MVDYDLDDVMYKITGAGDAQVDPMAMLQDAPQGQPQPEQLEQ